MILSACLALSAVLAPDGAMAIRLASLEKQSGGRLGVSILDTATGRTLEHRASERFPMCSTFKLVLAAAVLADVQTGRVALEQHVAFTSGDLVVHSPFCAGKVGQGTATVGELCAAMLSVSDNAAANLLLRLIGGPGALTAFARRIGDADFRLDRLEPDINEARPGDPRDTSTPRAMRKTLQNLLTGAALGEASRRQLGAWLAECSTGALRLKAGLPVGWRLQHRTGGGLRGTTNDIGVYLPPNRPGIFIVAYLTASSGTDAAREAILAEVGRVAAELPSR